jgi:site-specific DNA-methyltransferase (adenine-specific)/modification methylase
LRSPYYDEPGITIYCGDCREILPTLGPVDLVLTDPPYGIYKKGGKWGKKDQHVWDREPADVSSLLCAGTNQVIWGGNYYALPPSRGWLVWYKRDAVPSAADVELAWTSRDMNSCLIDQTIAATNAERIGHPTQKPLAVMLFSLSFFPDADLILDPFMGSGTTLVAAKELGRRAIGIELEREYCDIAIERLRQGVLPLAEIDPQPEQLSLEIA